MKKCMIYRNDPERSLDARSESSSCNTGSLLRVGV
ncbi:hypothetical protein EYZ11_012256 [Aspergillus tanneri]|uniref:Uncharacterized protein n=1 Tax=Aspergillus tanneri TaxID=1220188 RepID=A0A4S3J0Q2_9EURO|nr:hypothetical protein EYZ11_012256 [Aspergillus tanneri]